MAYIKTEWKNREVERPRTFNLQQNEDGTHTLIPAEGTIIEQGTPIIAQNMNKIEEVLELHDTDISQQDVRTNTLYQGENLIASKKKTRINIKNMEGKTDIIEGQGFRGIVNPTVEVGTTRHTIEITLHGMNGVYDEIIRESGVVKKVERFKEMVLDGSLVWSWAGSMTGYKQITTPISQFRGLIPDTTDLKTVKYDGKILDSVTGYTAPDQVYSGSSNLSITIANTDSGWGQNYTPTADEIKAYFLGWKMYVSGSGADTQYNGTGTKGWVYRRSDGSYSQGYSVLPTTKASDYNSYRLLYQKAQPETITVSTQGTAVLEEGENTVKVTQGVVVREKANPIYESGSKNYQINNGNHADFVGSRFKYKSNLIMKIYKNSDDDTLNWNIINNPTFAFGNAMATIPEAKFDKTATYYVTYEILPELTAQTDNIEVEYSQNIKSIVDEHTEQLSVHEERLDNVEKTYAKKDEPAQWITPTLLNGWTTPSRPVRFTKDSLDFVHLDGQIVGGTNQTTPFVFPKGYRPSRAVSIFAVKTDNTSTTQFNVNADGSVTVYNPSGTGTINFIGTFKAEQ